MHLYGKYAKYVFDDGEREAARGRERGRMAAMMMTSRLRTGLISFIRPGLIGLPAMAPCSTMPPGTSDAAAEVTAELEEKIVAQLGESTAAVVRDTSGGCGTMYNIEVESPSFNGLSTVKQHKLVADILKVGFSDSWPMPQALVWMLVLGFADAMCLVLLLSKLTQSRIYSFTRSFPSYSHEQDDIKKWHGFTMKTRKPR